MKLYHGSNVEIQAIDLSKSRPFKDFGKAFYLSADKNQAFEMGQSKAALFGGNPVISIFEFDESIMSSSELKVKVFERYDKEWADFIFANRNKKNKDFSHGYDIVYGPIANDSVGNPSSMNFVRGRWISNRLLSSHIVSRSGPFL